MRKVIHRLRRNPYLARPIPPRVFVWLATGVVIGLLGWFGYGLINRDPVVTDFQSCVDAGNPRLESYPEQCVYQGQSYINPAQNVPDPFIQQKLEQHER